MSKKYPGGLITKTPVVPAGPFASGSASGVWTLDQQAYYKSQGIWPTAGLFAGTVNSLYGTAVTSGQVALDSSSNVFVSGQYNGNAFFLAKYDSSLNLLWQRVLSAEISAGGNRLVCDSSGNVYVTGEFHKSGGDWGYGYAILVKYNSSGTLQFNRGLIWQANNDYTNGQGIAISPDGSTITVVGRYVESQNRPFRFSYDTSGNNLSYNAFSGSTNPSEFASMVYDSNGTQQITGFTAGGQNLLHCTITSGGTVTGRIITPGGTKGSGSYGSGITVDGSGNFYISGWSNNKAIVIKGSISSTALAWTRYLTPPAGPTETYSGEIVTDPSGNIYTAGITGGSGVFKGYVVKYNSSGNVVWQKQITGGTNVQLGGIKYDSINNNVVVSGLVTVSGTNRLLVLALNAAGGNGVATVGGQAITISDYTFTSSNANLSAGSGGINYAGGGFSAVSSGLNGSTPTLTSSTASF